jgi:cob(I)alamin adenosyltransferase
VYRYYGGMAKIYTKTGDRGETGLRGGQRVPKNHVRVEACGAIDEANALLGVVVSQLTDPRLQSTLEHIQGMLFEAGAVMADLHVRHHRPDDGDVTELELAIDELTSHLPPLTAFILPGGTQTAALVHLARTVVRRAERRCVTVSQHQDVPDAVIRYLNRLSDYLFTLARFINHTHSIQEKQWHPE